MRALFRFRLITLLVMVLVASGFVWMNTRVNMEIISFGQRVRDNSWVFTYYFGWPLEIHEGAEPFAFENTPNADHIRHVGNQYTPYIKSEFVHLYARPVSFSTERGEWKPWGLAGNIMILLVSTLASGILFEWLLRRRPPKT